MQPDTGSSRALSHNGDTIDVATEIADGLLDKLEGLYLVEHPVVTWWVPVTCAQEPCRDKGEEETVRSGLSGLGLVMKAFMKDLHVLLINTY